MSELDYGIIQSKTSNTTQAVWIKGTTVGGIHAEYCGSPEFYDAQQWRVIYRGKKEEYTGKAPDQREWL